MLAATGSALAALSLGRGAVSAQIASTAGYDSNVYGTHEATGDWFGTVTPMLTYTREAGWIEAEAHVGITFVRFLDQARLDAENADAGAVVRISESSYRNYAGSLSAAYHEASDVNSDVNARIQTNTATYVGRVALITGPRSNVAFSANYADTGREGASDQQILTTEALYDYKDFFYGNSLRLVGAYDELRSSGENDRGIPLRQNATVFSAGLGRALYHDTLRAGISYGYRVLRRSAAETDNGETRRAGYVISASLEGPFLPARYFPKVKSEFAVSYQDAATPGINDTGSQELTGSLVLSWQARTNTRVSFAARRSQRLSVNDLTVLTSSVQLGFEQVLRHNLTGTLNAGYDWSTYRTIARSDETTTLRAGLKYNFARSWDADFSYLAVFNQSTRRESTFDRHLVSLGLIYQF